MELTNWGAIERPELVDIQAIQPLTFALPFSEPVADPLTQCNMIALTRFLSFAEHRKSFWSLSSMYSVTKPSQPSSVVNYKDSQAPDPITTLFILRLPPCQSA